MYIQSLDPLTIAFVREEAGITTLRQAYASTVTIKRQLTQNTEGQKVTNLVQLLGNLTLNTANVPK